MYEKLVIYLKELIIKNECIILPDFGGFETEIIPAKIDKINKKLIPPSKKIIFKEEYKKDNGIIANYISQKENRTLEEAYNILKDFVNFVKNEIDTKGFFELANIGTFRKIGEKIYFFQNYDETFSLDSFGFSPIDFKEIENYTNNNFKKNDFSNKTEKSKKIDSSTEPIKKNKTKNKSAFWIITIMLLITIVFCFIIILLQLKKTTLPGEIVIGKKDTTFFLNNVNSNSNYHLVKQQNQLKTSDTLFYIIAGSFHELKYAKELSQELLKKGFKSNIFFTENKIYRVAIDTTFLNKQQAYVYLQTLLQKTSYHLWILPLNYQPEIIK